MVHVMLYITLVLDILAAVIVVGQIGKTPETVVPGAAVFVTVYAALVETALYFSYLHARTGAAQVVAAVIGAGLLASLANVLYLVGKPRKPRTWTGALTVLLVNAAEAGALLYVIASS
jgi:hypothetical protein